MADYTYLLTRKATKGPPQGKSQLVDASSPQAALAAAAEELFEIQRVEGAAAKLLREQLQPGSADEQAGEGSDAPD